MHFFLNPRFSAFEDLVLQTLITTSLITVLRKRGTHLNYGHSAQGKAAISMLSDLSLFLHTARFFKTITSKTYSLVRRDIKFYSKLTSKCHKGKLQLLGDNKGKEYKQQIHSVTSKFEKIVKRFILLKREEKRCSGGRVFQQHHIA